MASKKKRSSPTRAKKAKATRSGGGGKKRASAKAATRPRAKVAKRASAKVAKRASAKVAKRAGAKATKRPAKRAPVRKPAAPTAPTARPELLDDVLEEPLLDASTILRVKDRVARTQRDVDEDELRQFPDPSLVVEVQISEVRVDDDAATEDSAAGLPDLFASEARRQAARAREARSSGAAPERRQGSLFGPLGSSPPADDPDESDEE